IQLDPPIDLRPTVLVADDDDGIRQWLHTTLSIKGWRVVTVASAPDALTAIPAEHPDLIVLDQHMPEMTGLECAAELRANGIDGPIILISALVAREAVELAERLHVVPVSKVDHSTLLATIDVVRAEVIDIRDHQRTTVESPAAPVRSETSERNRGRG